MVEALEVLRQIQTDLKGKAEKFAELKAKNKYTLKNIALSLQKNNKPYESLEETLHSLDQNIEKTSFQAMLQKDPYNLNNTYSDNAANLFFFDMTNITVRLNNKETKITFYDEDPCPQVYGFTSSSQRSCT